MVVVLAVEVAEGSRGARARVEARARVGMLVAELVVEVAEGGRRAWVVGSVAVVMPGAQCLLTYPPCCPVAV